MDWNLLTDQLFGTGHGIGREGDFLRGTVEFDGEAIAVIGTTNHAPIGVQLALAQARAVLDTVLLHVRHGRVGGDPRRLVRRHLRGVAVQHGVEDPADGAAALALSYKWLKASEGGHAALDLH